jgi:putative ABC transport system substrate-binding protein
VYRIAIVHPNAPIADMSETGDHPYYPVFLKELRSRGYVEGRNLALERYSGEGRPERYAEVARNAVWSKPDVILASSTRMVGHLKEATTTIPIVGVTADPVAGGLVASLSRPGGNITGVSVDAGLEPLGKRFGILREAVPGTARVAFLAPRGLWDSTLNPNHMRELRQAAQHLGISLLDAALDSPIRETEYRRVFAVMERADALVVSDAAENFIHRRLIVELAEKARLPAIYPDRTFAEAGGLLSYGPDFTDLFRRAANKVVQILKGAKPEEIPFEQPTKFELVINLKAAKAIGLDIPPPILARADEVIE